MISKNPMRQPSQTFRVEVNGREVRLTYQQLFAAGYRLWLRHEFEQAAKVFRRLTSVSDRGPRAHIMLAHCCAMLGDYAGCSTTLSEGLEEAEYKAVAGTLHEIFVYWKVGLFVEVKQLLKKLAAEQPQLPTLCLLLAELLSDAGNPRLPKKFLQLSITRDRPDGAIALIAQECLNRESVTKDSEERGS